MSPEKKMRILAQFVSMAFFALLLPIAYFLITFMIFTLAPISYWVEYRSVEPSKSVYSVGEDIYFMSDRDINRTVRVDFVDILYCSLDSVGNSTYYANYNSSSVVQKGSIVSLVGWRWGGSAPDEPATCYLVAGIDVQLNSLIHKYVKIKSSNFRIE